MRKKFHLVVLLSTNLLLPVGLTFAESNTEKVAGDNTKLNSERQKPTAADQGFSEKDTSTTAKIRSSIVEDDSLSTYAHNIKIITRDGQVVLRGPVRSEQEKKIVISKAQTIAGKSNVKEDIKVVKQ